MQEKTLRSLKFRLMDACPHAVVDALRRARKRRRQDRKAGRRG